MKARLTVVAVICFGFAGLLAVRAIHIQLIGDARLKRLSNRQFQTKMMVRSKRGQILDRYGEALALNVETKSLAASPARIKLKDPEVKKTVRSLAQILGIPAQQLFAKFKGDRNFIWIKRHLGDSVLAHLATKDLPDGIWLVPESRRAYPHGELASQILGDVDIDSEGLEGVELWYNSVLRGKDRWVVANRDALGRSAFMDPKHSETLQADEGQTVMLSVHSALQFGVERALLQAVERTQAKSGFAAVMDSVSGELVAMAHYPSFDARHRASEFKKNRILTDLFEPGSILKPILLAAALENGKKLSDKVHGGWGEFKISGKKISEAETHEKWGWIDLKKMIQVSSNVGSAKLAIELGPEKYQRELSLFGFGFKTGVGFPGEASGMIPKKWTPLTLANVGFGQGISVTGLQMLQAYAAIANGGWLVQPTLIKEPAFQSQPPKRIIKKEVAAAITEALLAVTEKEGTGMKANVPGYRVAGKTGTAQMVEPGTRGYSNKHFISSFVGFPINVEPKLVVITSLDYPKGIYYASETAAPLFSEILREIIRCYNLPPVEPSIDRLQLLAAQAIRKIDGVSTPPMKVESGNLADGSMGWKIPSLTGLSAREVLGMASLTDLKIEFVGYGRVVNQFPSSGTLVAKGSLLRVVFSDDSL